MRMYLYERIRSRAFSGNNKKQKHKILWKFTKS